MIRRRSALAGALSCLALPAFARTGAVESEPGVEIAWAAFDMASGRTLSANPDRRMPMCSSFKWLLAAHALARVDAGQERLDRKIGFGPSALLEYAPTVRAALDAAGGVRAELTIAELYRSILVNSDNAAANLLLAEVGGPVGHTAWLRSIGDTVTRLDRNEPSMNYVVPGDERDTTTPSTMIGDLRRILYGDVLKPASRELLLRGMLDCQVGEKRLKAGLPPGWLIAHRTGTKPSKPGHAPEDRSAYVDLGVLLRPGGEPIFIAAYIVGSDRPPAEVEGWFAKLAGLAAR